MRGTFSSLAPCTTTALWKGSGPHGSRVTIFSVQKLGQEARLCGLRPHPALFLGVLSIRGNILKGGGDRLDLARTLCQQGTIPPSIPLHSWELLNIVPRVTVGTQKLRTMGRGSPRILLTPDEGISEAASWKTEIAVSHMHSSEKCSVCTHESSLKQLLCARPRLAWGSQRNQPHLFPHLHLALGSKEKGVGAESMFQTGLQGKYLQHGGSWPGLLLQDHECLWLRQEFPRGLGCLLGLQPQARGLRKGAPARWCLLPSLPEIPVPRAIQGIQNREVMGSRGTFNHIFATGAEWEYCTETFHMALLVLL